MNYIQGLIHPDTRSKLKSIDHQNMWFEDGNKLPIINGIPVLISKNSIFKLSDIEEFKTTTQNEKYTNTKYFKNYVRRNWIPALSKDFHFKKRYSHLKERLPLESKVLILGAGDKGDMYRGIFDNSIVIISDVHLIFNPDMVMDAHFIPFENDTFDLVLASQVIEHTLKPWLVSQECQRVVKENGFIQMEAPQNFPYHAQPYDFYRFTFTGMRSLFEKCKVLEVNITEGNSAVLAITLSNYFVSLFKKRIIRILLLFISSIAFGWLKYMDTYKLNRRTVSNPKGFAFTFQKDNIERDSRQLLEEFYSLKE